mmetsp:Transcript_1650/g.2572  ORF Transcript_1650/g.2572 Transcript_1650/m.2572 type:complete len:83 (-) Transcript_1650:379-627(-)
MGVEWKYAVRGVPPEAEKYEFLQSIPKSEDTAIWFYYLKNDPVVKPDGWYKYDEDNAALVEDLQGQYMASYHAGRFSTRFAQ